MRIMFWLSSSLFAISVVFMQPFVTSARAQEVDWQKVDDAFGRRPAVTDDVRRYGFPRSDLNVTLDGVTIKPALALGGWVAFKPIHGGAMVMGDLKRLLVFNGEKAVDLSGIELSVSNDPATILRNGIRIVELLKSDVRQTIVMSPAPHSFKLLSMRIPPLHGLAGGTMAYPGNATRANPTPTGLCPGVTTRNADTTPLGLDACGCGVPG